MSFEIDGNAFYDFEISCQPYVENIRKQVTADVEKFKSALKEGKNTAELGEIITESKKHKTFYQKQLDGVKKYVYEPYKNVRDLVKEWTEWIDEQYSVFEMSKEELLIDLQSIFDLENTNDRLLFEHVQKGLVDMQPKNARTALRKRIQEPYDWIPKRRTIEIVCNEKQYKDIQKEIRKIYE
jgi:hypothetical protein